jgi:endonuclease/exonuclease/phosphatase family metal-dependent hydrolase
MTYNVHSCIGTDGFAFTERVAAVIARSRADVIALQEVDTGLARTGLVDQGEELADILEMEFHFHPSLHLKGGRYGNAILSRYPIRLMRGGPLPTPWGVRSLERRGVLWVEILAEEKPVQILNTHFGLLGSERLIQAEVLLGTEWLRHPQCRPPVVLCGDFNTSSRSKVFRRMVQILNDVQAEIKGWRPRKTWPGRYPIVRLDHLFVSRDISVQGVEVPNDELTRTASDHLPLIADLSLP